MNFFLMNWKFCVLFLGVLLFFWQMYLRFGSRIHSRELLYVLSGNLPLMGRPDLVMQEWGGLLVCHDLKTRKSNRVFESDILQLSLYAFILRQATGRRIAKYAFVRIKSDKGFESHRVNLTWTDEDIFQLYSRFQQCQVNPFLAQMTAKSFVCKNCGFNGVECKGLAPRLRR